MSIASLSYISSPVARVLGGLLAFLPSIITANADEPLSVDLVILAGQSNAVGFDAVPSDLPADALDQQVLIWWRCGDPPPDESDSRCQSWLHLRPQPKGNPITPRHGRQYGNFANDDGGFGPEISFARQIARDAQRPLAILKVAFNGTGIQRDWSPDPKSPGDCFTALCDELQRSTAAAVDGDVKLIPRAFLWVQGESDANASDAPKYQQRLARLISAIREKTDCPRLPALIAVNTRFGSGKNAFMPQIVSAQQQLADSDPHTVYVDTSTAETINPAHFSTAGTIAVGKMFAQALRALEAKQ